MFSRRGFFTKIAAIAACVAIAPKIAFGVVEKSWPVKFKIRGVCQKADYQKMMSEMISRAVILSKQLS